MARAMLTHAGAPLEVIGTANQIAAVRRALEAHNELLVACKLMFPYLPTRDETLNYAAGNEGRATDWHVAAHAVDAAIAKAEPGA